MVLLLDSGVEEKGGCKFVVLYSKAPDAVAGKNNWRERLSGCCEMVNCINLLFWFDPTKSGKLGGSQTNLDITDLTIRVQNHVISKSWYS